MPIKLREETELSIRKYINVQCDNIIELHDIIALARYFDIALKISLRLCHILANEDRSRFGMTAVDLHAALSLLESNRIRLNGEHLRVGSNLNSTELIVSTLTKAGKDIYALKDQISFISLGGGYPTSTEFCDAVMVNDEYPRKIYEALSQLGCDLHKLTVIIEPRRVISEIMVIYFQCDKIVQFCVSKHILWVTCICCPMASVDIDSNLPLMTMS
ncbi:hypothetical protein [Bartonella krasnovii]|uniref:hypothetical protein n=1 Tax=Bartonella krasnovii TaxID=2267275 RepID=UPI0030C72548